MKRAKLVEIVKRLAVEQKGLLEQLKAERRELERPDFVWHYLLTSMSTQGNARGWLGLIDNQDNYQRVTFEALSALPPEERLGTLQATMQAAKVRMPNKKARAMDQNYEKIAA